MGEGGGSGDATLYIHIFIYIVILLDETIEKRIDNSLSRSHYFSILDRYISYDILCFRFILFSDLIKKNRY